MFAPRSTHNIISAMPNREVADVDDVDSSGQAIDTVADRQIFGTHDSLIEYTTCTLSRDEQFVFLAEIRWNYKGLRTHRQDDGWMNSKPHEWTDSQSQRAQQQLNYITAAFPCPFLFIETKSNKWLIRTSEKWSFPEFDIDSMIPFPLFTSQKWELMEFRIFNLHPLDRLQMIDTKSKTSNEIKIWQRMSNTTAKIGEFQSFRREKKIACTQHKEYLRRKIAWLDTHKKSFQHQLDSTMKSASRRNVWMRLLSITPKINT